MSMRRMAATVIRRLGLSRTADDLRYRWHLLRHKRRLDAARQRHSGIPLPPPYFIYETYRLDYDRYLRTGLADAQWIIENASRHYDLDGVSILDWGCGPARVLRHLFHLLPKAANIHGADYNSRYIDWCKTAFPQATFEKNKLLPPFSFPDNQFGLIYSISVFTHLSETAQKSWINELARVLERKGLLLLTTHGEITKQNLSHSERQKFEKGEIVSRGNVREGHRMFAAYQPPQAMRALFAPLFEILEHQPGRKEDWGFSQDLWILRKK